MKNARFVIFLYLITLCVMVGGTGLALWRNWEIKIESTKSKLTHDASMLSAMVDANIIDAIKLLEFTKSRFGKEISEPSDLQKHRILNSTVEQFSFYQQKNLFGLLLYIDQNGRIRAQNVNGNLPETNVTDRRYFKSLQNDPTQRFALGNLVKSRVNGTWVFHVATPLPYQSDRFSGLLLQQIKADDLTNILNNSLNLDNERLMVFLQDGLVAFSYPDMPKPETANQTVGYKYELEQIEQSNLIRGSLSPGLLNGDHLIGFMKSASLGFTTVAIISTDAILSQFIAEQAYLLLYTVLAGMAITCLFFLFYKKTIDFDLLQRKSVHDALTGLHNRRGLDEQLPELLRQAERTHEPISVLFIDIDNFKRFNDEFGHETGDQVLMHLARTLENSLQRPMDFLCRWGGEEFVVVLPNTDQYGAQHIAERILNDVRQLTCVFAMSATQITVSIGLSTMIRNPENKHEDLIDQADKAMLNAKINGRNRISIYDQEV